MTDTQYKVLIILLVVIGLACPAFMFELTTYLECYYSIGERCERLILLGDDWKDVGIYTRFGLPGIILGAIVPFCLFALAFVMAIGPKGWGPKKDK